LKRIRNYVGLLMTVTFTLASSQAQGFWLPTNEYGGVSFSLNGSEILNHPSMSKITFVKQVEKYGYPIQDCFEIDKRDCNLENVTTGNSWDSGAIRAQADIVFPVCSDSILTSCIETLAVYESGTQPQPATLSQYSLPVEGIKPKEAPGLPAGGSIPLFAVNSELMSPNASLVAARITARFQYNPFLSQFEQQTLNAVVTPISFKSSSRYCLPGWESQAAGTYSSDRPASNLFSTCTRAGTLFVNGNRAATPESFTPGTRVDLKLRLSKSIGGWFSGQFGDVSARLSDYGPEDSILEVSADAVTVPQFQVVIPPELITPEGIKFGTRSVYEDVNQSRVRFGGYQISPSSEMALQGIAQLRETAGDRSSGENVVWNFRPADKWQGAKCGNSVAGITGIVATNAMAYSGTQPSFANGLFDFKVGGMHFHSDGSKAVGSYDLVMRSDFARCLYGFSKAPVSGTVSVLSEDGTPSVATTLVTEANGFIRLSARNFGFSEKQITAKLVQPKAPIICQRIVNKKVKETRKVNAAGCPKGFTKKVK